MCTANTAPSGAPTTFTLTYERPHFAGNAVQYSPMYTAIAATAQTLPACTCLRRQSRCQRAERLPVHLYPF